jgi:hypothetical protein
LLEARVRLVSPEEHQALDLEFDAMVDDPNVTTVLLGSGAPGPHARDLSEHASYWALAMPSRLPSIADAIDVVEVVQEAVIEALWQQGRSASWPECPEHGVTRWIR